MRILPLALAVAAAVPAAAAAANDNAPPYEALAKALGVPSLVNSVGPKDKSQLQLQFAKDGQSATDWTKLLTVNITEVPVDETSDSTYEIVQNFKQSLDDRHVHVDTFDSSSVKPYSTYFEFHVGSERDRGVIYSPHPGFVTIAQLAEKADDTITDDDLKILKEVAGRDTPP